jgi:hypothetical protein
MPNLENKERITESFKRKMQTCIHKHIRITSDLSTQTLKVRKAWSNIIQALRENNYLPKILYPAKMSFKLEGEIKTFQNKDKVKQFISMKPALKRIQEGIIHLEQNKK